MICRIAAMFRNPCAESTTGVGLESATVTVKGNCPNSVAAPVIFPVLAFIARPPGNPLTDHFSGAVPFTAVNESAYGCVCSPSLNVDFTIATCESTIIDVANVAVCGKV